PIEPQWRDYYATALCISAYLGYIKYDIIADDTLAHITLTDPYRSQILAATTPQPTEAAPTPPAPPAPTTDNATPAPAPAECSETTTTPPHALADAATTTATDNAAIDNAAASPSETAAAPADAATASTTPNTPPNTPPAAPPAAPTRAVRPRATIAAANFRLKAVTTASLKGSLCNSRGQGRRGRPQPSDSILYAKSLEDVTLPTRASPQSPANQRNTLIAPISPISLSAHPPPRRFSAALS
ncbi:MAG: hypothetical protein ACI30K_07050, partial [Muribaculaceae bacterium]